MAHVELSREDFAHVRVERAHHSLQVVCKEERMFKTPLSFYDLHKEIHMQYVYMFKYTVYMNTYMYMYMYMYVLLNLNLSVMSIRICTRTCTSKLAVHELQLIPGR